MIFRLFTTDFRWPFSMEAFRRVDAYRLHVPYNNVTSTPSRPVSSRSYKIVWPFSMEPFRRVDAYRITIPQESIPASTLGDQIQSFEAPQTDALRIAIAMQLFHFCAMLIRYFGLEIELRPVRTHPIVEQSIRPSSVHAEVVAREIPEPLKIPGIIRTVVQYSEDGMTRQKQISGISEEQYNHISVDIPMPAFEVQKLVTVIPTQPNESNVAQRRDPVLEGDVVREVMSEKIIILSPWLLGTIKETIAEQSFAAMTSSHQPEIMAPYGIICAYRENFDRRIKEIEVDLELREKASEADVELQKKASEDSRAMRRRRNDQVTKLEHLRLFLEEIDKAQADSIRLEQIRHSAKLATFDMLWMLLKPETDVYTSIGNESMTARVRCLEWISDMSDERSGVYTRVTVHMWFLDHDGITIRQRKHQVDIFRFEGAKSVLDLLAYPKSFSDDNSRKRVDEDNAELYRWLFIPRFRSLSYEGRIAPYASNPFMTTSHKTYQGEVIVDPFMNHVEDDTPEFISWMYEKSSDRLDAWSLGERNVDKTIRNALDESPSLLSHWIRGFTISPPGDLECVWLHVQVGELSCCRNHDFPLYEKFHEHDQVPVTILVDKLRQIVGRTPEWVSGIGDRGFGERTVWSMSRRGNEKKESELIVVCCERDADVILTVEDIVHGLDRPLLRLDCDELDPTRLAQKLNTYLSRAERWGAILSIENADILFPNEDSVHSHARVSAFLHAHMYNSGIVILTTYQVHKLAIPVINRALFVGCFDNEDMAGAFLNKWGEEFSHGVRDRIRAIFKDKLEVGMHWRRHELMHIKSRISRIIADQYAVDIYMVEREVDSLRKEINLQRRSNEEVLRKAYAKEKEREGEKRDRTIPLEIEPGV